MMTTTRVATAAAQIAASARTAVDLGQQPDAALDLAARCAQQHAADARNRRGVFRTETSAEAIEEALFTGSVAADILDGTISRPSTGNVREFALAVLATDTAGLDVEL